MACAYCNIYWWYLVSQNFFLLNRNIVLLHLYLYHPVSLKMAVAHDEIIRTPDRLSKTIIVVDHFRTVRVFKPVWAKHSILLVSHILSVVKSPVTLPLKRKQKPRISKAISKILVFQLSLLILVLLSPPYYKHAVPWVPFQGRNRTPLPSSSFTVRLAYTGQESKCRRYLTTKVGEVGALGSRFQKRGNTVKVV